MKTPLRERRRGAGMALAQRRRVYPKATVCMSQLTSDLEGSS
ncbi:hypothetical protein X907_2788 [Glycocaulis alkaliphilus]|uniref:Uncharacterized protein n=1 Tax=Glycocaulis alkaliphilus TaxID=1434191 RepID=A0A3T0EDC2_9PROT|nr:hypothetical protein X907_2788 [Glycocaulis alkaliphilus]